MSFKSTRRITCALAASLGVAQAEPARHAQSGFGVVVPTAQGKIRGARLVPEGAIAWRGVPFAAAPVGPLRWMPPQPPALRTDTLQTTRYQAACYQPGAKSSSEDCLYLNIWRPDSVARNLPVIVWIHGGSNISGDGSGSWYAPAVKLNAVIVSVNYRLGALGWFRHPALATGSAAGDSGNFGTLDQIAALAWVHDNIANFGGDPTNVTLAGESAGSQNVSYLLHSPLATPYFAKAMVESNYPGIRPVAAAEKSTAQVVDNLLVTDGKAPDALAAKHLAARMTHAELAAYLRGKMPDQLYAAYKTPWFGAIDWGDFYRTDIDAADTRSAPPLIQQVKNRPEFVYAIGDGAVLPAIPFADFSQGNAYPKPLIVGNTHDENNLWNAYFPFNYQAGKSLSQLLAEGAAASNPHYKKWQRFYRIFGHGQAKEFGANYSFATQLIDALDIYLASILPARNLASYTDAGTNPVYVYRFDWASTQQRDYGFANQEAWKFYCGSVHGSELDFFWQSFAGIGGHAPPSGPTYTDANLPGRQALSDQLAAWLTAFVHNPHGVIGQVAGAPDWLPWQQSSAFMDMDADKAAARSAMRAPGNVATPEQLYAQVAASHNRAVRDFVDYYVLWSWGWNWYAKAQAGHFNTAPGPNRLFQPPQ